MYDYAASLSEVFSEDTCQKIEDRSHAVLIRDGDCRLIIQGSDQLHVLLALSIVEDIVARFETNVSDSSRRCSSAMVDIDKVLQRAYSNDDEMENSFDWSLMPEEVKRAVLVSLLDSDVSGAAGVGLENVTNEQVVREPAETVTAVVSSSNSNTGATASVSATSSIVTASRLADLPSKPDISHPVIQPLVRLAKSKGYSEEEIENVLSRASQSTESEFLRTLHTNRRIQQSSVSVAETLQEHESIVTVPSRVADRDAHIYALGQSLICSAYDAAAPSQRVGTDSMKTANVEDFGHRDTCMDVDEANFDDSVILLKSDAESDSSDDDDIENLETGKEDDGNSRFAPFPSLLSSEQAQKIAAVQLGASPLQRKKKKKRKKKKASANPTVQQPAVEQPSVMKTGTDINDLDAISLMPPPASSPTVVVSDDEVVIDVSSDSDVPVEVPDSDASMKLVCSRREQRQLARQKQARNQFPIVQPSRTSSSAFRTTRQPDFPAPPFIPVPAAPAAAGNVNA